MKKMIHLRGQIKQIKKKKKKKKRVKKKEMN